MVLSKFENLPPELIVEIGDYLDGCDLYFTIYGLNQRINTILDNECHRLHVNFVRISKIKFDLCCSWILPHIGSRIVSLTLGGDNSSTPGQLALFLGSFNILAKIFSKLESLKLIDFTKLDVQLLLPHLSALTHLKCLSIGEYKRLMPFNRNTDELFHENVMLPISLRWLAFPYEVSNEWIQTAGTMQSSVEQLHAHFIHMSSLSSFLQQFPHLKSLTAVLVDDHNNNLQIGNMLQSTITFHGLRYLNVNITQLVIFDDFARFLRSVPQLHSLSIEALNPNLAFLEAHLWEIVLPPNLYSFRFDLTMTLTVNPNHLELLEPFKSQFWVSRGWIVQCHLRDRGRYFRLSTVQSPIITILYWPDDEVLLGSTTTAIYSQVIHLELWWNLSKSTEAMCPNIRSIQLYGAANNISESFHPNVCKILQCPSLEHIFINDDLSISQIRFASVLLKSSDNVHTLTCSIRWLHTMLEDRQYEWICLLISTRIRKLIINDETELANTDLIAFCRTFINLKEITMKVGSAQVFFFLLNTLEQVTMVKITLPSTVLDNVTDITQWIQNNTILTDFVLRTQATTVGNCKLILWIGSRRISNLSQTRNDCFLKHAITNQYILQN